MVVKLFDGIEVVLDQVEQITTRLQRFESSFDTLLLSKRTVRLDDGSEVIMSEAVRGEIMSRDKIQN